MSILNLLSLSRNKSIAKTRFLLLIPGFVAIVAGIVLHNIGLLRSNMLLVIGILILAVGIYYSIQRPTPKPQNRS